jgi:hypothetical protein
MIQFPGKARELARNQFGECVVQAGGIRFFQKFEQVNQIFAQGMVTTIVDKILTDCIQNKWSENSSNKMYLEFGSAESKAALGMALVESAAIVSIGEDLCKACYTAEGDSPLILTASDIFERLERHLSSDFDLDSCQDAITQAVSLIQSCKSPMVEKQNQLNLKLKDKQDSFNACKAKLDSLLQERQTVTTSGRSSRGRSRQVSRRAMNEDALEAVRASIMQGRKDVQTLKDDLEVVKEEVLSFEHYFLEWSSKFPHQDQTSLGNHCKSIIVPVIGYYENLFHSEDGDNASVRKAANACKLFNPFFLKDNCNNIPLLNTFADSLCAFEFRQFTPEFIHCIKREIPKAVEMACAPFDWDSIGNTTLFKTRLQKRLKKRPNHYVNWMDDPGEKANRIWQYWRITFLHSPRKFPSFQLALRLVVLSQLSSCAVERVFSRLKMVRETCKDSLLEDMLENRILLQCNGDISEIV